MAKKWLKFIFLIAGSFVFTGTAAAAIAVDATVTKGQAASTTIVSPAFSTTSSNELILAFIATDGPTNGTNVIVNNVTGAGLTWALVRRTNAQAGTSEIWRTLAPNALSNVTVTATLSQSQSASITIMSFSGADTSGTSGSGAIGATNSGSASTGAPTASLTTTRVNSLVVGVGNDWEKAVARTPGTNQSPLVSQYLAPVGDTYWVQRQQTSTPASGTSVTINDTAPTTDRYNLAIAEILPANAAPVAPAITSTNSTTFTVGSAGSFTVTATGSPAPTFSETGALPTGVTLTTAGVLSGTPAAGTGGTYPITITAQNGVSPNATQSFTLTVRQAPAITSSNSTTFAVGSAGTFTVTATGFPAPTLSETGALPGGVGFDTATGILSGTPTASGNFPITFTAQNGVPPNATQNFPLTVNPPPKIAPTVTFTGAPGTLVYQGTFTVASTTNSTALPVYTASGSCSNVGTLYTMSSGTGTCTSTVTWAADATYNGATLSQTTTASKSSQTITFTEAAPASASSGSTFPVAARSSSGLTVALSVDAVSTSVCSLGAQTTVSGVTSATVTMLSASGTCTIDGNQTGNANYSAAGQQQTSAAAVPPPPDFTISGTPGSATVLPGGIATYTVTIGAQNGFSGSVDLSASGQPSGATLSFGQSPVPAPGSTTMTVTTLTTTPLASSTLTITGTSGTLMHSSPVTLIVSNATSGGGISINFVGRGTTMATTESAGFVARGFWNNATGASSTSALALRDETGSLTGATASWTSNNVWSTSIVDQAGNARMMKGYLDTSNSSVTTVTVAGLGGGTYDVYVYGDGDNGTASRTAVYRISGTGITATSINLTDAANTNFNGTLTQANSTNGNYVKFSSITANEFTLTATPDTASDGTPRAPLNGIQIIPTGPPKIAPTVTFTGAPGTLVYQGTFTVASTTNSTALPVYTASGSCSNVGTLYTMSSGTGTCTSTVTWAADATYNGATLSQTTTASKSSQTITFTEAAPASASSGSTFPVAARSSSGLTVALSVDAVSTSVCSLGAQTTVSGVTSATVTMLSASGTCTIDGNQAGNANYSAAGQQQTSAAAVPPPPDFTISGTPGSATVLPGGIATYTVTIGAQNGFSGSVDLSASGQPSGATLSFGQSPVPAPGSTTMTVTTLTTTPLASSTLTITGTSGTLMHSSPVTLIVSNATFTISGAITPAASGSGTTLNLTGPETKSATANGSGIYSFSVSTAGTYTVTPVKSGFSFSPSSQDATITNANVSGINFTASALATRNLTVNGSTVLQTIDGMGVNINVNSWNGGQLMPALDYLVDVNGSSIFRVIRDPMTWVSSESLIAPLHNLDPTTLAQVYETPAMQDIWNTIWYLNLKGVNGNQILLNFMGWTPTWIGGSGKFGTSSFTTSGKETQFATMVASLIYYGRRVKNLSFNYVSPLNELDWNCLEGPCVGTSQYVTIMNALNTELNAMGVTDVRFVSPETASDPAGYISALSGSSAAFGRTDHLTLHAYGTTRSPGTSFAGKNYWMTETADSCSNCDTAGTPAQGEWSFASNSADLVLHDLVDGLSSVMVYDAYDSFYYHHNSFGFWGLLGFDQATGVYTPRKRFYTNAQVNKYIRPGAKLLGLTTSISTLDPVVAAYDSTNGKVTIVGYNWGTSSITINGLLSNIPANITSLNFSHTNSSVNMQQNAAVPVSGGNFTAMVPADSIFTLTNW